MVIRELLAAAPCARLDSEVLLAHILGVPREKLLFLYDKAVSIEDAARFSSLAAKRKDGCPLSYIVGEREFYSLPFRVTPATLIPRPDTETLVDWAIPISKSCRVLDLCCGTGCIGLSIAKNTAVDSLTLADISADALAVAKENADALGVPASFVKLDILADTIPNTFDIIVSNPPYIETAVIDTLAPDVRFYEPLLALDGGADGLLFYPVIIEKSAKALRAGGHLGLEIGHQQGEAVQSMMQKYFADVRVLQDFGGHDRVVVGRKNV